MLLRRRQRDQATQPLRLPLLLINLRPQLSRLHTQLLRILLKRHKLIPPQITLRHQKIQPPRQPPDLRLQIVPRVHERRRPFADRELDVLFRGGELGLTADGAEGGDTFEEGRFTEFVLQDEVEGLDDAGRVPPFGGFDRVGDGGGGAAAFGLDFADGSETAGGEGFFEFAVLQKN